MPVSTKPEDRDFLSYLNDLKYDAAMKNLDNYIKDLIIINFHIIHHECRGDKLEKSYEYYQTIKDKELKNYEGTDKKKLLGSWFHNQKNTKQDIFFEKDVIKNHFSC